MLVKESRPRQAGAFAGTESRVWELPDVDPATNEPVPLPEGAKLADPGDVPHDWQPDKPAGGK